MEHKRFLFRHRKFGNSFNCHNVGLSIHYRAGRIALYSIGIHIHPIIKKRFLSTLVGLEGVGLRLDFSNT
jgi:hypothetical protein